jgi:hypothetical protein
MKPSQSTNEIVDRALARVRTGAPPIAPVNGRDRDHVPEAPRPLMRELPPADPFPTDALGELLAKHPARLPARQKKLPSRGGRFRPSCELKTCTPATRSAWASGHFSGQTAGRDSSARFGS